MHTDCFTQNKEARIGCDAVLSKTSYREDQNAPTEAQRTMMARALADAFRGRNTSPTLSIPTSEKGSHSHSPPSHSTQTQSIRAPNNPISITLTDLQSPSLSLGDNAALADVFDGDWDAWDGSRVYVPSGNSGSRGSAVLGDVMAADNAALADVLDSEWDAWDGE